MSEAVPVLEFRSADLKPADQPASRVEGVSLALPPGSAAAVLTAAPTHSMEAQVDYVPLADAANGLLACAAGEVLFRGRNWAAMPPLEQARNRGRIGRLFDFHGWVYNLTILENLVLAARAHGRGGPDPENEAVALARRFGFAGIPEGRPVLLKKREMRMFEWIRAFLGQPDLLILERPEFDLPRLALSICFELAQEAQGRGAALLWITHDPDLARRVAETGAASYEIRGRRWHAGRTHE